MASLADETPEGRSIVDLAVEKGLTGTPPKDSSPVPFSATTRISGLDARFKADTGQVGHLESLRLAMKRLHELSAAVGHDLANADWHRKKEIIRTLAQRIEIDTDVIRVIFRLTQNARGSDDDSVVATLQRL